MRTIGHINRVEFLVEELVRKIASDNDRTVLRLSKENGRLALLCEQLRSANASLEMENDMLRREADEHSLLAQAACGNA